MVLQHIFHYGWIKPCLCYSLLVCSSIYPSISLYNFWEHAAALWPPFQSIRCPSTNVQRSWTPSIWDIILYEIDGWGQPLTERVKTTLRCPLWMSMMENRLLKKIYVCSYPTTLPCSHPHPGPDQSQSFLWSRGTDPALFSCQLCKN